MKNGPVPLHYQITNELRERLRKGEWNVGDLFPTDKELMEKYGVSSTTVRRAISELVREGWLERKPGKGTFVKKEFVETLARLTGFFEEVRARGHRPSALLLRAAEVAVEDFEDLELDIFGQDKVFLIEKIQFMDGSPVVLVKSFWPVEIGHELMKHDLSSRGTYDIVRSELGQVLEEAEQEIFASEAGEEEATHLGISPGAPVLVMKRVVFAGGRPLELSLNFYRADRYKYRVHLKRDGIGAGTGVIIGLNQD